MTNEVKLPPPERWFASPCGRIVHSEDFANRVILTLSQMAVIMVLDQHRALEPPAYELAGAYILEEAEVCSPIRKLFRRSPLLDVLLVSPAPGVWALNLPPGVTLMVHNKAA